MLCPRTSGYSVDIMATHMSNQPGANQWEQNACYWKLFQAMVNNGFCALLNTRKAQPWHFELVSHKTSTAACVTTRDVRWGAAKQDIE